MKNEIEQIAQQNKMSIEFVSWFFNEKKANCGNVWFMMMAAMWEGWKGRSIEMDKLAAENVALKRVPETDSVAMLLALDSFRSESLPDVGLQKAFESLMYHRKTPATDRIYAEIKADAIDEAAVELDRVDTVASTRVIGFKLREFAKQLREGADK
ncbi:TPA: hypothetical protein P7Z40_004674 [Klebsiella pneumoniae]|uniref:hypothetical protein n=1 Tax=Klebsiella pneumoniae TaxID=573 RepID=UPI0019192C66|nr:hypothetical protein [Klebsiella pneumoniae]ELA1795458.1 hypothetical protein [Klebsiella pneumoniae]UZI77445.1 hypothetical protein JMX00_25360 [Klebsiella pneumoniae]HBZ8381695.1 hypothetical protein [Klebsiella pneumoniae]HCA9686599.1 hypothetical protein [Klebsiella pneumoniae]